MSIESYYVPGIVIQRKSTVTRSALNAPVAAYATHLTISGLIRPMTGHEAQASQRDNVFSTHMLICAVADILAGDRAVYGGMTYEIHFPRNPMNMNRQMEIEMSVVQV